MSRLRPDWSCASSWFSTARAASIAAIALSPALIASMIASTCEVVVDDVVPESSCVVLELSDDVSVLLIGPPVDVLIGPPVDELIGPVDDVSDSVNSKPVLVDIIIVLLGWAGSSEKLVLVVLGDEGFDSAVVGLLDPLEPVDPLDPLELDPLVDVREVDVRDWIAARAA